MFEREIKFIYDFNLNKVNKLGPYFTFEQLAATDINPAILHYISAEINYLIFEDRQKLLKNSIFDYSNDVIAYHFSQISDEVKKTKRFALEYIGKLILHASSFTINYLARPKWTLTKFIFDEGDHKTTFEIKQILEYVYYYPYLKKILISYINKKKIISMNSDEFIELLNKVDRLGMDTYLPSILNSSLKSMSEFFNIGEVQKSKVPVSAVELFLDEKQLFDHIRSLKKNLGDDSSGKYDIQDYLRILSAVVPEKQEVVEEESHDDYGSGESLEPVADSGEETEDRYTPDERFEEGQEELSREIENTHKKLRIRIDQDNRIEPAGEETEEYIIPEEESVMDDEVAAEDEDGIGDIFIREQEPSVDEAENQETENSDEEDFPEEELEVAETAEEETSKEPESELPDIEVPEEDTLEAGEEFGKMPSVYSESNDDEVVADEAGSNESVQDDKLVFTDESWDSDFDKEEESETQTEVEEEEVKEELKINGFSDEDDENTVADEEEEFDTFSNILNPSAGVSETVEEVEVSYNKSPEPSPVNSNDDVPKIEIADLLEHKDTTRIIEVIYDYDIEEFAATIDSISNCSTLEDALVILNQTLRNHHVDRDSKEAESFKSIISEYFNRK